MLKQVTVKMRKINPQEYLTDTTAAYVASKLHIEFAFGFTGNFKVISLLCGIVVHPRHYILEVIFGNHLIISGTDVIGVQSGLVVKQPSDVALLGFCKTRDADIFKFHGFGTQYELNPLFCYTIAGAFVIYLLLYFRQF